jgi:hypothetical protein
MPEAPQDYRERSPSPFGLRDESSSEASHNGSEIPLDEPEGVVPTPPRTEEWAEPTPKPSTEQTLRRIKHTAQRKKFGPRDRMASIIFEAEEMLGRLRYSPSEVEGFQPDLCSSAETEEGCEGEETPEISLTVEEVSPSPVTTSRDLTVNPEGHNEEAETDPGSCTATPHLDQDRQISEEGTTGGSRLFPEPVVRETFGSGEFERSEVPLEVEARTAPQENLRHSEPEAVPAEEDVPNTEGPNTSRPRSPFDILGRGLRGCPMEVVQNLIPEDFLGGARVTSPEKIAQGIMISHYQVTYFYLGNF